MCTQAIKQLFVLRMMDFIRCFISVVRRWPAIKQLLPICCTPTLSNSYWLKVPKCVIKNKDSLVNIIILSSFGSLNSTSLHRVCKLGAHESHFSLLSQTFLVDGGDSNVSGFPRRRPNEMVYAWTKQSSKYTFHVWSLCKGKGRGRSSWKGFAPTESVFSFSTEI